MYANRLVTLFVIGLLVGLPPAAQAAGGPAPLMQKRYIAIDLGTSRAHAELTDSGFTSMPGVDKTDSSEGFRIRFGYQFGRFIAAEIGYADFGRFEYSFESTNCPPPTVGSCTYRSRASLRGPLANIVGVFPLDERWQLKARAGAFQVKSSVTESDFGAAQPGVNTRYSDSNSGLHFGAGVAYQFNQPLELELSWTYYQQIGLGLTLGGGAATFDQGSSSLTSLGVAYRF